jgi:geranylgeranyl pyrophosphate synthase
VKAIHYLQEYQHQINQALDKVLPSSSLAPQNLHKAMRYATLGNGKRLRPSLVYATGNIFDLTTQQLDIVACAIELIHAYSLIHDDLPAMDNDDLRRGRLTCHKAFDEATAILAGDALQTLAFQLLAEHAHTQYSADQCLSMISTLAYASGSLGMAGGQALDLAAVNTKLSLAEIEEIHSKKTGAIISASIALATIAAGSRCSKEPKIQLGNYANLIGLAFQIQDDILDIEGNTLTLGKQQGADLAQNKSTYPMIIGMAKAKQKVQELYLRALACLTGFNAAAEPLRLITEHIIQRDN